MSYKKKDGFSPHLMTVKKYVNVTLQSINVLCIQTPNSHFAIEK